MEDERSRRLIPIRGGVNFRDLGGYDASQGRRVAWGLVFRSGTTHRLDASDIKLLGGLRIRSLLDFRTAGERLQFPHGLADQPGMTYMYSDHDHGSGNLSRMISNVNLGAEHMDAELTSLYRGLPYDFSGMYKKMFLHLASGRLPLAFNCAAGKDRTGVAAALLLDALGVRWDDILSDYMMSERSLSELTNIYGWTEERLNSGQYCRAALDALFGVKPMYLEAMKESLSDRSDSIHNYLVSDLGLDADIVEVLQRRLLVPK